MKNILLTSLAAGALASAALGLAGTATAAPSGPSSVDATISQLQAQGFQVIVSRVDSAAVDQCTLNAVRPGQTFSRTDSGVPGAQRRPCHHGDQQDRLRRRHLLRPPVGAGRAQSASFGGDAGRGRRPAWTRLSCSSVVCR